MLVYTVFVTVRFFRRYFLARRESRSSELDPTHASERSKKNLIAELSCGVGTLRSIASAAPFLGLAGTCYGILALFSRRDVGSRGYLVADLLVATISLELSTALVATAAGLIVAIPAAVFHNALRTRLERLAGNRSSTLLEATPRSYGFAQTLLLRRRFSGLPAFALIGAPVLAILIPMFVVFQRFQLPKGLHVHLLKIGVNDQDSEPIIISVVGTNAGQPVVYVNSKKTPWDQLEAAVQSELRVHPQSAVYVQAENDVRWAYVVDIVDIVEGLHTRVVLVTDKPRGIVHPR
jgi:biopolymer transport protein ExbD